MTFESKLLRMMFTTLGFGLLHCLLIVHKGFLVVDLQCLKQSEKEEKSSYILVQQGPLPIIQLLWWKRHVENFSELHETYPYARKR